MSTLQHANPHGGFLPLPAKLPETKSFSAAIHGEVNKREMRVIKGKISNKRAIGLPFWFL